MSPSVEPGDPAGRADNRLDGTDVVGPDAALMARRLYLANNHGPDTLARMLVETEQLVAHQVDQLGRAELTAMVEARTRDLALDMSRLFRQTVDGIRALIAAGRAGELSMPGLVPVSELRALLDAIGAPETAPNLLDPDPEPGRSYGAGVGNSTGPDPASPAPAPRAAPGQARPEPPVGPV